MDETLKEELQNYLFQYKDYLFSERRLSKNSISSYYTDVRDFYQYLINIKEPFLNDNPNNFDSLLTLKVIDEYIIELSKNKISSRSISRKISAISLFIRFLKLEQKLTNNISHLIERPKVVKKIPNYLTVEEVELFINSFDEGKAESLRDRTLFELIYSCGLRVSELSDLDIDSVYKKEGVIRIFGKGSKERYIPIGSRALNLLDKYLSESRPILYKKKKVTKALFLNFRGERLTRKGIWSNLKAKAKTLGIKKDFSVHTLRHSFATHLIQNGADLLAIKEMLGHKNISTTEIYTHLDNSYLHDIYSKFHSHN